MLKIETHANSLEASLQLSVFSKGAKMKKLSSCFVSTFFVVLSLFTDGVEPIGYGTETDPYQVEILDNLLWICTNPDSWDKHFIQIADIDAADTQNWNNGEGFYPIGNIDNNLTGNYNWQEYIINGLYIYRPEAENQGLFGYTVLILPAIKRITTYSVFTRNIFY